MYSILKMILLFLMSLGAGILASLVGIGGGVIFVPMFNLFMGLPIEDAIGTSMCTIIFTSLSGSIYYAKEKRIDYKTGLLMEITTIPGAIVGAATTELLPEVVLKSIFFSFLFFSGFKLIRRKDTKKSSNVAFKRSSLKFLNIGWERKFTDTQGKEWSYFVNVPLMLMSGFLAGFISGLLGIGGGTLKVPLLAIVLGIPVHIATATSTFMILLTSISGGITHLYLGHVHLEIVLVAALGAILGAQMGPRLNIKVSPRYLRKIVGTVLILVAANMAYNTIYLLTSP
ncbi:MAG: sulfite exporter TauE/SafE family protein [Candidatus Odinarchaeota archaeon]|nr:sulfite exporter TauE/SafE family protein [Candidatus Odinarchaeota archaeon]